MFYEALLNTQSLHATDFRKLNEYETSKTINLNSSMRALSAFNRPYLFVLNLQIDPRLLYFIYLTNVSFFGSSCLLILSFSSFTFYRTIVENFLIKKSPLFFLRNERFLLPTRRPLTIKNLLFRKKLYRPYLQFFTKKKYKFHAAIKFNSLFNYSKLRKNRSYNPNQLHKNLHFFDTLTSKKYTHRTRLILNRN
jgi:hypothetical protein